MKDLRRKLAKGLQLFGLGTLALLLGGGLYLLARLTDDEPVTYESDVDHFKYGSTGGERGHGYQFGFGVPYWVWIALPELFPDLLPDKQPGRGYQSFGMIYEEGRDPRFDLPIGMSMRREKSTGRRAASRVIAKASSKPLWASCIASSSSRKITSSQRRAE